MNNDYNLIRAVINSSESSEWYEAVNEWEVWDCEEDNRCESTCICGKEHIKYLFEIRNKLNGKTLYPIGSSCIKKFGREELNEDVDIAESRFKLLHAIRTNKYIELSSEYFSRRLIYSLYIDCAFDNKFNNFDGTTDYEFFLKMFNKRNKELITPRQWSKIRAIIAYSIKPFLEERLSSKIK